MIVRDLRWGPHVRFACPVLICAVLLTSVSPRSIAASQDPEDPPELPPLRTDLAVLDVDSISRYRELESNETMTIRTVIEDGGTVRWERRDQRSEGAVRSTFARFEIAQPYRLSAAGGASVTADGTTQQSLEWPADRDETTLPVRNWVKTLRGESSRGTERIPAPPSTELHLAALLRRIAWGYGFELRIPVLWDLEASGEGPFEPLRRAFIHCSGRETIDIRDGLTPCWRIVVESQGRRGPLRGVYWIGTRPPYHLERWEENDGRVFDRIEAPAPDAGVTPPRGSGEESQEGSPQPGETSRPEEPSESPEDEGSRDG